MRSLSDIILAGTSPPLESPMMASGIGLDMILSDKFLHQSSISSHVTILAPSGFGLSILGTGLSLVPFALGVFFLAIVTGKLVSRTGVKPLAILGATLSAMAFLAIAFSTSYDEILLFEFFTGGGISLMNASLINLIVLTVNPKDMGQATAMNGTFRNVGSSIGAPIAGSIMSTITAIYVVGVVGKVTIYASLPTPAAYFTVFMISAAAFAVAAVLSLSAHEVLGKRKWIRVANDVKKPNPVSIPE